jgi:hypothetical protein
MSGTFPPPGPVTLPKVIPSYLYEQYYDDDNLQGFVAAQNIMAQWFVDWFTWIGLPYYPGLRDGLLDWIGSGVYGYPRPTLVVATTTEIGGYDTAPYNVQAYNEATPLTTGAANPVNDDIYCRLLTWHRYNGDGLQYSTRWLKRRVHRFLNGPFGVLGTNDNTFDVSVRHVGANITIGVPDTPTARTFSYALTDGFLALPYQYSYTVVFAPLVMRQGGVGRLRATAGVILRSGVGGRGSGVGTISTSPRVISRASARLSGVGHVGGR